MKIDTHQHFWKLDRGDYGWLTAELEPLFHDFLPADLAPLMRENKVDGTIVVQAAPTIAETEFMLSLADTHDWILGVVGWVDLEAPDAQAIIARLAQHPKLLGLRPMIQDIPDDDWMLRDTLRPAIAAMMAHELTFDALVLPRHLKNLDRFLGRYEGLTTVINHCAKPHIRDQQIEPWAADIAEIAQHPNVFCKVSGLVTEAAPDWTMGDLFPYIQHVLDVFGSDRLLWGSDWPVLNLAGDYSRWNATIADCQKTTLKSCSFAKMAANTKRAYPRITNLT